MLTITLDAETADRLRRLASASGESVEALAKGVLEETAAEFAGAMGDDQELARRIAAWKVDRASIAADDVHAYLRARAVNPDTPRPPATKR